METTLEIKIHQKHELFPLDHYISEVGSYKRFASNTKIQNKRLSLPILQWSKGDNFWNM